MLLTNRKVAIGLICWRLLNALCVQTFFNPDEYWQSVEIAHRMVYGYGYLTWEWDEGIRGILHPLLFAALYAFLKWLQLDQYPWVCLNMLMIISEMNHRSFCTLLRYSRPCLPLVQISILI